jgi:hypothetical protein
VIVRHLVLLADLGYYILLCGFLAMIQLVRYQSHEAE